jgi:prolyl-tRNA editing enzyme YbaK/EbsC (Cys-tRNA(Pro) deacylase)
VSDVEAASSSRFGTPLEWLRRFPLAQPVVTCQEAADAKRVPLEHELKTLLLLTDVGVVAVHVRGDRRVSLRAVKRQLGTAQARMLGEAGLTDLRLEPGTVNPFAPAIASAPQLVAPAVFDLAWVTTNAGRLDQYVVFHPMVLRTIDRLQVADIEEASA